MNISPIVKHYWTYCTMCEHNVVICGKCGNNCCNGGYGEIDGVTCTACPSAYKLYFAGENDETISL